MSTLLTIMAAWCVVSVLFAGFHHRWVHYVVTEPAPEPMDVLRALPPLQPLPDPDTKVFRGMQVAIRLRSFAAN